MGLIYHSFSKPVCKRKPNKFFMQIYRSFGKADIVHRRQRLKGRQGSYFDLKWRRRVKTKKVQVEAIFTHYYANKKYCMRLITTSKRYIFHWLRRLFSAYGYACRSSRGLRYLVFSCVNLHTLRSTSRPCTFSQIYCMRTFSFLCKSLYERFTYKYFHIQLEKLNAVCQYNYIYNLH